MNKIVKKVFDNVMIDDEALLLVTFVLTLTTHQERNENTHQEKNKIWSSRKKQDPTVKS